MCLAPMAYKWCSAISEVAGIGLQSMSLFQNRPESSGPGGFLSQVLEQKFSFVGPDCDPVRMGETSPHTRKHPQALIGFHPRIFLFEALEVGFRPVMPGSDKLAFRLDDTHYHELVFKSAFSSHDDEVIADGVCAWIVDSNRMPAGSCAHYLAVRVNKDTPFSPRLRRMSIRLIECMWRSKLWVSEWETILLLNYINVGVDDMDGRDVWAEFLVNVICSPTGLEGLSVRYWHLLEGLPLAQDFPEESVMEAVRSLEEVEDWEKLEDLMVIAWQSNAYEFRGLKRATLKHLRRRPSALLRFEGLPRSKKIRADKRTALKGICTQVRTEQLPLESPLS